MSIDKKAFGLSDSLVNAVNEALKGGQVKIDKNHNGKIDGQDFKMLRKEEGGDKTNPKQGSSVNPKDRIAENPDVVSTLRKLRNPTPGKVDPKTNETKPTNANESYIEEKLTKGDSASKWIHDFVHSDNPKFAGKSKSERQKQGLAAYYAKQRNEEVEQVDELSKKTMGSYIKKASHDVATKSAATGRYADRANTVKDQMKKGDYSNYQQGKKDDATADKMFNKSWKRRAGIAKATDKLTKEDVQVDEVLDTNVKKFAYLMKAKKSIKKSDPNDIKQANDIANRTIGVKRLMKKLTKEEVVDEALNPKKIAADHAAGHSVDVIVQNHLNKRGDNKDEILKVIRANAWNKRMDKKKVSEDVEQVDELSKATLGSYVNKSAASLGKAGYNAGSTDGTAAKLDPHIHTINKRSTGIKRAVGKLAKEDTQIDELSTDTYHSAAHKAAKKAMGDAQGRSGPIFKKYAGMANKFRDKGMSQEKKEKAAKDAKSAKMKAYRADRDKHMEEEIQIDEISKKLAARYNNKVGPIINKNQNSGGDPAKLLKRKNREAGHKLSWNKYHNYKVKVPATEETDPGFAEATENPIAKELAAKKTEIQKSIAQKKMQVMQAKAQKTISAMKESKKGCTCTEGKKSMSCEVCNDKAMGIKGGKEKIQLNPPLRD